MPAKKPHQEKASRRRTKMVSRDSLLPLTWPGERSSSNGTKYEYQMIRNPYVPGEREKMLESRKKLTLKAFQIAYENQHK